MLDRGLGLDVLAIIARRLALWDARLVCRAFRDVTPRSWWRTVDRAVIAAALRGTPAWVARLTCRMFLRAVPRELNRCWDAVTSLDRCRLAVDLGLDDRRALVHATVAGRFDVVNWLYARRRLPTPIPHVVDGLRAARKDARLRMRSLGRESTEFKDLNAWQMAMKEASNASTPARLL
jgi:hypothetical protein